MKAAVLDGYTLNPGDISWEPLRACADVTIYDKTEAHEVYERIKDCEAVFTNKTVLSRDVIARLPKLRYIGVLATGFNVIDVEAAHTAGITVTNIPAYSTDSVAQLVFAFILHFYWHCKEHSDGVHAGVWSKSPHFCYTAFPVYELSGKTLGIIGYGSIGQKVAEIGTAMGMKIIYANRSRKAAAHLPAAQQTDGESLFRQADIISLNAPLTPQTSGMITAEVLKLVKKDVLIINTARGQLIDEQAVADALKSGRIGGYAADVLAVEPPSPQNPLFGCPNCIITPHIAWQAQEARQRLLDIAVKNFTQFTAGTPQNCV